MLTGASLVAVLAALLGETTAAKKGDRDDRKGRRKRKKGKGTGCAGCFAGTSCLSGDSDTACGKNGVACASCAAGQVCVGNGVCAFACDPNNPLSCPCAGVICVSNLSGGPAGVCVAEPAVCSIANCADCAAMGRVCIFGSASCPNHQVCATPC